MKEQAFAKVEDGQPVKNVFFKESIILLGLWCFIFNGGEQGEVLLQATNTAMGKIYIYMIIRMSL